MFSLYFFSLSPCLFRSRCFSPSALLCKSLIPSQTIRALLRFPFSIGRKHLVSFLLSAAVTHLVTPQFICIHSECRLTAPSLRIHMCFAFHFTPVACHEVSCVKVYFSSPATFHTICRCFESSVRFCWAFELVFGFLAPFLPLALFHFVFFLFFDAITWKLETCIGGILTYINAILVQRIHCLRSHSMVKIGLSLRRSALCTSRIQWLGSVCFGDIHNVPGRPHV